MSLQTGNSFFSNGAYLEAINEYKKINSTSPLYVYAERNIKLAQRKLKNKITDTTLKNFETTKKICHQPKISVIIPVYNAEDYLEDCINSLRKQSLKEIELIFVDDGSTDSSSKIIASHMLLDDRIKIIKQKNKFAGAARNNGLSIAKGEYIVFIDSDDFVNLELLEKAYKKALETNAEVVVFDACEFDSITKEFKSCKFPLDRSLFPKKDTFHYLEIKDKIFQANSCIPWNKLFKKELIDRSGVLFQEIKSSNDTVFVYSLLVEADSMTFLNEVLVYYRINNPKSLQRSKSKSWECIFQAFYALKLRLEYIGAYQAVKRSFINKSLRAFIYYMETIDKDARKIMECSFVNKYHDLFEMDCVDKDYIYLSDNYKHYSSIMKKKYVPIVYACDKGYLPHTYISIKSLIANISSETHVVIHIMHDSSIVDLDKKAFQDLNSDQIVISFIDMNDVFRDAKLTIPHTSYVTYFRLKIHDYLGFYDKIIYLDSDTIINCDIMTLYKTDINDFYAAGVKAIAFNNAKHQNRLKIDVSQYVNAGVLLLNNKKIIDDKIYQRFPSLMARGYSCQDQDIINVAFCGKIKSLDKSFNFMTKYIDVKNIEDLSNSDIKILHFADKIKPWNKKSAILSEYFWKYAKDTPYYKELINQIQE